MTLIDSFPINFVSVGGLLQIFQKQAQGQRQGKLIAVPAQCVLCTLTWIIA